MVRVTLMVRIKVKLNQICVPLISTTHFEPTTDKFLLHGMLIFGKLLIYFCVFYDQEGQYRCF